MRQSVNRIIYNLATEKNSETSARRLSDEACDNYHLLKWVPLPLMTLVGSHSSSGREKEGKKEIRGGKFMFEFYLECTNNWIEV
jgi:hypothetical protein